MIMALRGKRGETGSHDKVSVFPFGGARLPLAQATPVQPPTASHPEIGKAGKMSDRAVATFMEERERLIALACSIVRDQAIAEELVQESWLRWAGRKYSVSGAKPVFRRIVMNLAKDWYRRSKTELDVMSAQRLLANPTIDSERIVFARLEIISVARALAALPERTRAAFRMHRIEGLGYAEIGRKLGISPSTAFAHVETALVELVLATGPRL